MRNAAPLLEIEGWRPPPSGRGFYFQTEDDVRLRGAYWAGRGRGLAVILQGRTEFIEKFYGVARRFLDLGYDVAAVDWRGQGLSDRPLADRRKGHVADFGAYQQDLDAFLRALMDEGAPPPQEAARIFFAHSMGGCVAARALMRLNAADRVSAAILSAPMLRLAGGAARRVGMRALASLSGLAGRGEAYVAGAGPSTLADAGFENNPLTSDARHFRVYAALLAAHPDLALGGPTWRWLSAALRDMRAVTPSSTPCLAVLGLEDGVIDNAAARAYARATAKGRTLELSGARHEPYLEGPEHQQRIWRAIAGFLDEVGS